VRIGLRGRPLRTIRLVLERGRPARSTTSVEATSRPLEIIHIVDISMRSIRACLVSHAGQIRFVTDARARLRYAMTLTK